MTVSAYTLLIVESPTVGRIVQKMCPPSVYVISTDGFCWKPEYDADSHRLKAKADPEKLPIRKELKEQSHLASNIVIAVDTDASGDFIAWSLNRFLSTSNVKRARMQGLSKNSILSMLDESYELDETQLETRLKNRFMIHTLWSKHASIPDIQLAGLISVFGAEDQYQNFLDENDILYQSSKPIRCRFDEWITVRQVQNDDQYRIIKPLSTFDVLEYIGKKPLAATYHEAQHLLQELFQTLTPFSEESLISYPRTSARAFYSNTWEYLRKQYFQKGSVNELKPAWLREIADGDAPHESIHPIDLTIEPESVTGELPKKTGQLYKWIYEHTLKSISMPNSLEACLINELNPDAIFYPDQSAGIENTVSLRPCITLSELGIKLNQAGVVKPSSFGKNVDEWMSKGWIRVENGVAVPGREVIKQMNQAEALRQKLAELNRIKENSSLTPETVKEVITS